MSQYTHIETFPMWKLIAGIKGLIQSKRIYCQEQKQRNHKGLFSSGKDSVLEGNSIICHC